MPAPSSDSQHSTQPPKVKNVYRKRTWADEESIARRRDSLRSCTSVKDNEGDGCLVNYVEQTEKRDYLKISPDEQETVGRRESLRSNKALKNNDGERTLAVLYVEQNLEKVCEKRGRGRPEKQTMENVDKVHERRRPGRPKKQMKEKMEDFHVRRRPGRPNMKHTNEKVEKVHEKRRSGRPKKRTNEKVDNIKVEDVKVKVENSVKMEDVYEKRKSGRPKKQKVEDVHERRRSGRLKKSPLEVSLQKHSPRDDGGERAPVLHVEHTKAKRVHRKRRPDKQDISRRRASLRSAGNDNDGGRRLISDCEGGERDDEARKAEVFCCKSDGQSQRLGDENSCLQKHFDLSSGLGGTKRSKGEEEERARAKKRKNFEIMERAIFQNCEESSATIDCNETSPVEDPARMASPDREKLDTGMGDVEDEPRNRNSGGISIGGHKSVGKAGRIHAEPNGGEKLVEPKSHGCRSLGLPPALYTRLLEVTSSGDEQDATSSQERRVPDIVVISSDDEEDGAPAQERRVPDIVVSSVDEEDAKPSQERRVPDIVVFSSDDEEDLTPSPKRKVPDTDVVVISSDDEADDEAMISRDNVAGVHGKKRVDLALTLRNVAPAAGCSEAHMGGNRLAPQEVDRTASVDVEEVPMVPVDCKPPACMQKYGPWSARIRKDGKRWRKKMVRWTHIKRKYLVYRRAMEVRLGNDDTNMQSLLRKPNQKQEVGYPDDAPDDEDMPYEAYRRSSKRAEEVDPEEEELESLFQEMALAQMDKGWEKSETEDFQPTVVRKDDCYHNYVFLNNKGWVCGKCGFDGNEPTVFKRGDCYHNYIFVDDVGWMCEKCGLVAQDIQNIFIAQDSAPPKKKKAAIVPIEEAVEDFESEERQGLLITQRNLPRVNLTLHPFYEENLHPHQIEGIRFLTRNLLGDAETLLPPGGCILAHAPGTGKSCLTVSFVQTFLTAYPKGRPLIVAPKIMLNPWQNEFYEWNVEDIPVLNLNEWGKKGVKKACKERSELANAINATPHYKEKLGGRRLRLIKRWLETRSVLLVSYNLFACLVLAGLNDENTGSVKQQICAALLDGPELLILDEGHFPRTKRTKISQALMRVRTNRKILLSGTLFQNNFKELFNLMKLARHHFMSLSPEFASRLQKTDSWRQQAPSDEGDTPFAGKTPSELNLIGRECEEQMFMDHIGDKLEEFVEGAENFEEINAVLRKLRTLTAPMVHWYTGQILESLPGLCEFVVYLNLTAQQNRLLSQLKCKSSLEEKARLAEMCIHPELLNFEENHEQAMAQWDPSKGVKTAFLFNLVRLCRISGERLLVFCQTLSPLTLIESMLAKMFGWSRGAEILRLDGTMSSDERQSMIKEFNAGSSRACVMLASITACKEGISLVGASRVVILDVLYNPSVVRQAVSRAFRIGQKKKVYVYRLVAADTKEETIFQAAVQKEWLSRVLVDQSLRITSGDTYHSERILQEDAAPDDRVLQQMMQVDPAKRIDRVCRYHSDFSFK